MKRSVVVASALVGGVALSSVVLAGSPPAGGGEVVAPRTADKSRDVPVVPAVGKGIAAYKCTSVPCDYPVSQQIVLEGFKWGIHHLKVAEVYNQPGGLFDKEYDAILVHIQPGHTMQAVEAERDLLKESVSRSSSFIEFKNVVTGFDATPLRSEYTYRNRESVLVVDRGAWRRYFFFLGDPPRFAAQSLRAAPRHGSPE